MESMIVQYSEKNRHLLVLRIRKTLTKLSIGFLDMHPNPTFRKGNVLLAPSPIIVQCCPTLVTGLHISGLVVIVAWEHHQCI